MAESQCFRLNLKQGQLNTTHQLDNVVDNGVMCDVLWIISWHNDVMGILAISLHACGQLPKLPKLHVNCRLGSNSIVRFSLYARIMIN